MTEKKVTKKMSKRTKIVLGIVAALLILGGLFYYRSNEQKKKDLAAYSQMIASAENSYRSHEYAAAFNTLNDAIALVPNSPEAYQLTLTILIDKQQLGKASEVLTGVESALSKASVAGIWGGIGQSYYDLGDYENARKALDQSLDTQSSPAYSLLMAKVLLAQGSIEGMDDLLKDTDDPLKEIWAKYSVNAADDELTLFDATKNAGEYINAGYPYFAVKLLEPRATEAGEYWEGLYFLGKAYWDLGNSEKALTYLEQALTLGSEDPGLHTVLARVQYDQNDLNNALKSYDKALAFSAKDNVSALLVEYVSMLIEEEQHSKALATLVEYGEAEDKDSSLLYGKAYASSEDTEKLEEVLVEIAELKPDAAWGSYREYLIMAGEYYSSNAQYDEAEAMIAALIALNKYDPYVPYLSALVQIAKGESELAVTKLQLAIDYDLQGELTSRAKGLLSGIE